MELAEWRKHIDQVLEDEGQWFGILNENGYPIYEFGGLVRVSFPEARLATSSVEATVNVTPGDRLLDDLVGEGLGVVDDAGRLAPANGPLRMLCHITPGERQTAYITHTVVEGRGTPSTLTIHGVDLMDMLATWPCPSIPVEWGDKKFESWVTDASGTKYATPRTLAQLPFATKADGYTVSGPARDTVRHLVQDSFDAVNALYGWADAHAVVEFDGTRDESPRVVIRVNDDPVMETVAEPARSAGLGIEVRLWWPGDGPVYTRSETTRGGLVRSSWVSPKLIVRVYEVEE
ncbi:hypothetical protein ACKFRM_06880 [Corynebacterium sp. YSMAA1_1_D6]|uniref:hypothetical protein n=1 Tax=Corynebacterium sp. YSMAA1_1_D6 TaxID=3383589 RepID=UPI0038D10D0D